MRMSPLQLHFLSTSVLAIVFFSFFSITKLVFDYQPVNVLQRPFINIHPREFELHPGYIRVNHRLCADGVTSRELPLRRCYGLIPRPKDNTTRVPVPFDQLATNPFVRAIPDDQLVPYWKSGEILYYQPPYTERQAEKAEQLLGDMTTLLNMLNATWWPAAGTLLGSLRHSGPIPWDDDMDLHLLMNDFLPIFGILDAPKYEGFATGPGTLQTATDQTIGSSQKKLKPIYNTFSHQGMGRRWWLQHKDNFTEEEMRFVRAMQGKYEIMGDKIGSCGKVYFREDAGRGPWWPWGFPFLDLYCWIVDFDSRQFKSLYRDVVLNYTEVFPIHTRPFGELEVPVLSGLSSAVSALVFKDVFKRCITSEWDHANEAGQFTSYGICSHFFSVYPFTRSRQTVTVKTTNIPSWIMERLSPHRQTFIDEVRQHQDVIENLAKTFNTTLDAHYQPPTPAPETPSSQPEAAQTKTETMQPSKTEQQEPVVARRLSSVGSLRNDDLLNQTRFSPLESTLWTPGVIKPVIEISHDSKNRIEYAPALVHSSLMANGRALRVERSGVRHDALNRKQLKDIREVYELVLHQHQHPLHWDPSFIDVTVEEVWMGDDKIQTNLLFGGDYSEIIWSKDQ